MTHYDVFGSRALHRALLQPGMVETLPARHVGGVCLRKLL
jgi:hypothetical protein